MKTLQNPTTFFFKQADNYPDIYRQEIQNFTQKLLNPNSCVLCKEPFNFNQKLPRILVHCGHTLCTACLLNFYRQNLLNRNRRVRCPLCLKLIKHLDQIDLLPINHTIFTNMAKKFNMNSKGEKIDPNQYLYNAFDKAVKKAKERQVGLKIDPQTGIPLCLHHPQRVQHFYCLYHKLMACRVCAQTGHTKKQCAIADLYQVGHNWKSFVINGGKMNYMNGNFNRPIQACTNGFNNEYNGYGNKNNYVNGNGNVHYNLQDIQKQIEDELDSDSFSNKSI